MNGNSFVYDLAQEFTYKEEIDPISIVHFRTIQGLYDSSFGFDWLRIDEQPLVNEPAYKDIIEGGYKSTANTDMNKAEAYDKLKLEYERGKINYKPFSKEWLAEGTYHAPYLNLFSKQYSDTFKIRPAPTYKAKLTVLVTNSADIDKLEFKYDDKIFSVDISQFQQITWETQQTDAGVIEITCLKDFSQRKFIDVYAHPNVMGPCGEPTLAGRIVMMPNSLSHIKEAKFVFVSVITDITGGQKLQGGFSVPETVKLRKFCYQALLKPLIFINHKNKAGKNVPITLDLTNDPKFKVGTGYVDSNSNIQKKEISGGGIDLAKYLQNKFFLAPNNFKYIRCFTVFSFDLAAGAGGLLGYCDSNRNKTTGDLIAFLKNIVVFKSAIGRSKDIISHESLHGFGLMHTHREKNEVVIKTPGKKYIYPHGQVGDPTKATDNIMSYRIGNLKTTWKWQWDIIRRNI